MQKPTQIRNVCIFCLGQNDSSLSKEHLWPDWAADFLPERLDYGIIAGAADKKDRTHKVTKHFKRPGSLSNFQIRKACRHCNSGWMSKYENRLKPTLLHMWGNQPVVIPSETRIDLAQYFFYKMLLADSKFDRFVEPEVAARFYTVRKMPDDFSLWIMNCAEGPWRQGIRLVGGAFSANLKDPKAAPNVLTVSLGFGSIFAFGVFRKEGKFDPVLRLGSSIPLWPPRDQPFMWPPIVTISSAQAETISMVLWHHGRPRADDDYSGFPMFQRMI